MKNLFWILASLLSLFLSMNAAQEQVPRRVVGGYVRVNEPYDEQMHQAAAVAVQALRVGGQDYSFVPGLPSNLQAQGDVRIIRCFQQVVAGLNYRMILAIVPANEEESCLGAFAVTIYNRFGEMSVTTWGQEVECNRAMAALQDDSDLNEAMGKEFYRL